MSLTRRLTQLIHSKRVEQRDLEQAALFVLDTAASAIAGPSSAPGAILVDWARDSGLSEPDGDNGGGAKTALLLGALAHILEVDDLHRASVVHPGCAVVPVLWGVGRRGRDALEGEHALAAILRGYEAAIRVGRAVGPAHYKFWHNTATCGPFGSAMAAAHLLGLSHDQCVDALGNAGTQSAGLWEFIETGAMSKHLHAGRAAEAGLVAASLSLHGFSGASGILDGDRGFFAAMCPDADPDQVLAKPDAPWLLHETSLKPWPSCRHTHPSVDAALGLHREISTRGLYVDAIKSVEIGTYTAARALCDRPNPDTTYAAKFSLQHCVAAALRDGGVWFESFEATARSDLGALRKRIVLESDPDLEQSYPRQWGGRVALRLRNGETLRVARDHAKGDPELPLSALEIRDKAVRLMHLGGVEEPSALIEGICAMADGGAVPSLPPFLLKNHPSSPSSAAE